MRSLKWFLIFISVWFLLYCFEVSKGRWILASIPTQFILCWISLISSMVEVPYEEHRKLLIRLFKVEISTLESGVYFIPFLWIWGEVFIPKEFREDKKESHVHVDTRETRKHRKIGLIEDISREHFFPFIFGKGIWAFVLTCIISYGLNIKFIPYLENQTPIVNYIAGIFGYKKQIENQNNISTATIQNSTNQPQYNQATAPSGQKTKDYNGMDTATRPVDSSVKADNSTTVVNQNSYQSTEAPPAPIVDWLPPEDAYNPTITWDNLKTRDVWTALAKMTTEMDYVNERGYFVSSSNSYNYFPSVFVDGFRGDQNFFCHFFKVYIRKLTFKNGETWQDGNMDFCDYVNIVSSTSRVDNTCYRDVKIYLKDQFKGKYSWHIIDAGYGDGDLSFEIFLYDRDHDYQSVISQNETIRTGHQYREHRPMTNEMNSKYLSDSKSNPEQKSEEERRLNAKTNKKRKRGDPPGSNY
ncbi:MAG: hypothetical protein U0469_00805 [Candidatus Paceibacterota bacterium]